MDTFDLFVIGAGSGGVSASRYAASLGAKVGICEEDRVGGTCVIRGCVPKKLLVYASHFNEELKDAEGFGWNINKTNFNWQKLITSKNKEIDRLNSIYINMLEKAGVTLFKEKGTLIDQNTIKLGTKTVKAQKILIATGSSPTVPTLNGIEHAITSNEALNLEKLPERIAIVGGGYIAVEFASIFNGLGTEVHLIYRRDLLLRKFDIDIREHLTSTLKHKGIELKFNTNVMAIDKQGEDLHLTLTNGADLKVNTVLFATGRHPNTSGLNLKTIGVETDEKGAIIVNNHSQTSISNIFAVGDVTNRVNLTPVAIHEGRAFADSEFGKRKRTVNHQNTPSAVFSQPSVASIGITEEEAKAEFNEIDIYKSEFKPMKNTLANRNEKTLMKLIVDSASDKVIGAHMVGPDAAEIMQGITIAINCGATKTQFDETIGIHPTSAEEFVTMREKWKKKNEQAA